MDGQSKKNQAGFTLPELSIGLAVLSVGLVAAAQFQNGVLVQQARTKSNETMSSLVMQVNAALNSQRACAELFKNQRLPVATIEQTPAVNGSGGVTVNAGLTLRTGSHYQELNIDGLNWTRAAPVNASGGVGYQSVEGQPMALSPYSVTMRLRASSAGGGLFSQPIQYTRSFSFSVFTDAHQTIRSCSAIAMDPANTCVSLGGQFIAGKCRLDKRVVCNQFKDRAYDAGTGVCVYTGVTPPPPPPPPGCSSFAGTRCYWMENYSMNWCWIPGGFATEFTTIAECKGLDSCSGEGGGLSGGGCYKWADTSDSDPYPWP